MPSSPLSSTLPGEIRPSAWESTAAVWRKYHKVLERLRGGVGLWGTDVHLWVTGEAAWKTLLPRVERKGLKTSSALKSPSLLLISFTSSVSSFSTSSPLTSKTVKYWYYSKHSEENVSEDSIYMKEVFYYNVWMTCSLNHTRQQKLCFDG